MFRGSLADDAAHDFVRNWLEDDLDGECVSLGLRRDLFSFNGWMPQSADSWDHIAAVNHAAQTYLDYVLVQAYEELRSGGG